MDTKVLSLGIVCFAAIIVGALHIGFQLFKIASLDAEARGLSCPKLWGFLAMAAITPPG